MPRPMMWVAILYRLQFSTWFHFVIKHQALEGQHGQSCEHKSTSNHVRVHTTHTYTSHTNTHSSRTHISHYMHAEMLTNVTHITHTSPQQLIRGVKCYYVITHQYLGDQARSKRKQLKLVYYLRSWYRSGGIHDLDLCDDAASQIWIFVIYPVTG